MATQTTKPNTLAMVFLPGIDAVQLPPEDKQVKVPYLLSGTEEVSSSLLKKIIEQRIHSGRLAIYSALAIGMIALIGTALACTLITCPFTMSLILSATVPILLLSLTGAAIEIKNVNNLFFDTIQPNWWEPLDKTKGQSRVHQDVDDDAPKTKNTPPSKSEATREVLSWAAELENRKGSGNEDDDLLGSPWWA